MKKANAAKVMKHYNDQQDKLNKGGQILDADKKMLGIYGKMVEGNSTSKKQPRVEVQQVFKTKPFNFG
jgi:putative ubiquitin-RnfH superfamily antitoxin RatB of RatAB toxin-antitoxin module